MFEIIVFENHCYYDGDIYDNTNVIEKYINVCKHYVNPEYVSEKEAYFTYGKLFVSYSDHSGGDKPMNVILVGEITEEMRGTIQEKLKKFYIEQCEDCGVDISFKDSLCHECANK
jgi:hypothetical protein